MIGDDDEPAEQEQAAGDPNERCVLEEGGQDEAELGRAHRDADGNDHEERSNDACERTGPVACVWHGRHQHVLQPGALSSRCATERFRTAAPPS